jgi:phosphate uptake regulator
MIEETAYLLQNQMNPFPVSGQLELDEARGRLRFTLDEKAAEANLGWLEKALQTEGLKERIRSGERPIAFDLAVAGRRIKWPASLARVGMKVPDEARNWFVSLDYPSGGAIWQLMNLMGGGSKSRPWKEALAAAGAE